MRVKVTDFNIIATTAKSIMDNAVACYPLSVKIDDPYLEGLLFIRISHILSAMGQWYAQNFTIDTWESDLEIACHQVLDASRSIGKLCYSDDDGGLHDLTQKIEALVAELYS